MRRVLMVSMVMLLFVAACGGDSGDGSDDAGSDDGTEAVTTQPETQAGDEGADDGAAPTTAASPGDGGGDTGSGASVGTVTVGGETYQYADTGFPGLQCMPSSFNVAFIAALQQVDGSGEAMQGSLGVAVPFKGSEETAGILPAVSASVEDLEWIADQEHAELNSIPAGSSQVDSYEIDGDTISGTATFYERNSSFGQGELIVEQGTFEVTCADG